jgi:hypothetical protein
VYLFQALESLTAGSWAYFTWPAVYFWAKPGSVAAMLW